MRRAMSDLTRQIVTAAILSAVAVGAIVAAAGTARAADMPERVVEQPRVLACTGPQEIVVLYDERGYPTVPGRTEYYYCVTGTTLLPGDIPPPPEYCCSG